MTTGGGDGVRGTVCGVRGAGDGVRGAELMLAAAWGDFHPRCTLCLQWNRLLVRNRLGFGTSINDNQAISDHFLMGYHAAVWNRRNSSHGVYRKLLPI